MKLLDYLRGTPAFTPLTPSPETQCTKVTKAGKRCKLPPVKGSDKCAVHAGTP